MTRRAGRESEDGGGSRPIFNRPPPRTRSRDWLVIAPVIYLMLSPVLIGLFFNVGGTDYSGQVSPFQAPLEILVLDGIPVAFVTLVVGVLRRR